MAPLNEKSKAPHQNKGIKNPALKHVKQLSAIYKETLNSACKNLKSKNACILMLSEDEATFNIVAGTGDIKCAGTNNDISVNDVGIKNVLSIKHPQIIDSKKSGAGSPLFSPPMVAAPISTDDVYLGVLLVSGKNSGTVYDDYDKSTISLICDRLAYRLEVFALSQEKNTLIKEVEAVYAKCLELHESLNDAFFRIDSSGNIIDVNKTAVKMLRHSKERLLCMKMEDIVLSGSYDYQKVNKKRNLCNEVLFKRSDKGSVLTESNVSKVTIKSEQFYIITAREISEKKKLERKILDSQKKFTAIINGMKDGIYLVDKDHIIIAINEEQAKRSNISVEAAVGEKCFDVIYPEQGNCSVAECSISNAFKMKTVCKNHYNIINSDGMEEYTEVTAFPIFDAHDEVEQVMAVLRDVTRDRMMHQQLIYSEKLATLGTLSAKIGHEIRNPLTAVLTCAQFMEMKDKENKNIKIIISEASRIKGMVADLLTISRPKESSKTLIFLEKILEDVIDFLKNVTGQIKYHDVQKKFNDIPPITGNEDQLKQLFTNLILNASQAMEEAGKKEGELIIKTEFSKDNKYSITSICDCGNGIAKSDIVKIFDPFYTTKGTIGTGLGMAVAKEIVDSHNGSIKVKSDEGVGTTVSVYLPIPD